MIIQPPKQVNLVNVAGDFEGIEASMDASSLPFVLDMLSKALYSNPIGSLIREYTSNCFDSHIEANVDEAVKIEINEDDEGEFITFTDVGVGLSPERIKNIFMKYFTSTKRTTNDMIGGFGLGSKSGLAYTDWFYITTIVDNIKYQYIFSKGDTVPTLELLCENECIQHNGTEIKIYIKNYNDKQIFIRELKSQLCYFDNVYFIGCDIDNEYTIYESDLFKYKNKDQYNNEMHIVFGKVSYPIDWKQIGMTKDVAELDTYLFRGGGFTIDGSIKAKVGVKFEIGELSVTPSRESILYTNETKKLIRERVLKVREKLVELYNTQTKEHEDLFEWYKVQNEHKYILFGEDKCYLTDFKDLQTKDTLKIINELGLPKELIEKDFLSKFYHVSDRIYNNKVKNTYEGNITNIIINYTNTLVFSKDSNYTNLKNYFHNGKSILKLNNNIFRNLPFEVYAEIPKERKNVPKIKINSSFNDEGIIEEDELWFKSEYFNLGIAVKYYKLVKYIRKQVESRIKPYHFEVTEQHKEDYRATQIRNDNSLRRKLEGKVFCKGVSMYEDFDWKLQSLEDYKGLVVYGFQEDIKKLQKAVTFIYLNPTLRQYDDNKSSKDINYSQFVKQGKINTNRNNHINPKACKIIKISKTNEKYFKNKPNMIYVDNLYSDNKLFRQLASSFRIENLLAKYLKNYSSYETKDFINFIKDINKNIGDTFERLYNYQKLYRTDSKVAYTNIESKDLKNEILIVANKLNLFDKVIEPDIKIIEDYFKGVELLQHIDLNDETKPVILKYLREKKKKLNFEYYSRIVEPCMEGDQLKLDFEPKEIRIGFQVITNKLN